MNRLVLRFRKLLVPTSDRLWKSEYIYKNDTELSISGIESEVAYSDGTTKTVTDTSLMSATASMPKKR